MNRLIAVFRSIFPPIVVPSAPYVCGPCVRQTPLGCRILCNHSVVTL